jgi:NADH-quinone oxidoreductase subunit N
MRIKARLRPLRHNIGTVSKGVMFALLLRFSYDSGAHDLAPVFIVFRITAVACMIVSNRLALLQNNVKRILAYSSVAYLGCLLAASSGRRRSRPPVVTSYGFVFCDDQGGSMWSRSYRTVPVKRKT